MSTINHLTIAQVASDKGVARTTVLKWIELGKVDTEYILGKRRIIDNEKYRSRVPASWSTLPIDKADIAKLVSEAVEAKLGDRRMSLLAAISSIAKVKLRFPEGIKIGDRVGRLHLTILHGGEKYKLWVKEFAEHGIVCTNGSVWFYNHIVGVLGE